MKNLPALYFSVLFFFLRMTPGQTVPKCDHFNASGVEVYYCLHLPDSSRNEDILYYLHGSGNDETTWDDPYFYTAQIQDFWKSNKINPPRVISVSFELPKPLLKRWLFSEKNASPASGLLDLMTREVMPTLERYAGGLKGRRIVLGESMGGFNALQLALKTRLFQKVAALCSPTGTISPFASESEIEKAIESTLAWQYYKDNPRVILDSVKAIISLAKAFFPTENDWVTADPIHLGATVNISNLPKLYLAAGAYDQYAAYEGNVRLAEILKDRGAQVDWRPQWGGHCAIDIPSLATFLTQLRE